MLLKSPIVVLFFISETHFYICYWSCLNQMGLDLVMQI